MSTNITICTLWFFPLLYAGVFLIVLLYNAKRTKKRRKTKHAPLKTNNYEKNKDEGDVYSVTWDVKTSEVLEELRE